MADNREVVVIDIKMPFWSIVVLMIKWVIASIPGSSPSGSSPC